MKQTNKAQLNAYQELLAVAKWTVKMLDTDGIIYGENNAFPNSLEEFRNWEAAVRTAVAKAEVVEDSQQRSLRRTHADVHLPRFNQVFKQPLVK